MYRVKIDDYEIECETIEDVRALIGQKPAQGRPKAKRKVSDNQKSAIQKSWEAARKEAKKQGRTDVAAVRSELSQAKKK